MEIMRKIAGAWRWLHGRRRPRTAAVILAGGTGSRMGCADGTVKQLMLVRGEEVLLHSVRAFLNCSYVDELVVVSRKEDMQTVRLLLSRIQTKKPVRLVEGGATRQISARHGMEVLGDRVKFIALHDAVRCLITPDAIAKVISAAYVYRAASAGTAVTDTVKRINSCGFVTETVERECLFAAQTPQVFSLPLYRAATYTALANGDTVTDDNMLIELIGQRVKMVECGRENIKITVSEDLIIAEAVLAARERTGKDA